MVSPRRLMTTKHTNQHTDRDQTVTTSSRNPFPSETDKRSVPRSRPWGGPIWISLFGRDYVVRKPTKLGLTGSLMGSLGVGLVAWGSVKEFDPVRVGSVMFLAGVILICFKRLEDGHHRLEEKNLGGDEIYKLAHDRGIEEGYEDGYHEGMIYGERRRPHVAPLPSCPNCGTATGLRSVASLANRG